MFEIPAILSCTFDIALLVLYAYKPKLFEDSRSHTISRLNPVKSVFLVTLLSAIRLISFLPYIWLYAKNRSITKAELPRIWFFANITIISVSAVCQIGARESDVFIWFLFLSSYISVLCQYFSCKHLISTALPDRHVVLEYSYSSGNVDVEEDLRTLLIPNDTKLDGSIRRSDRSHSQNTNPFESIKHNLTKTRIEWNRKIESFKNALLDIGREATGLRAYEEDEVFEELLQLFANTETSACRSYHGVGGGTHTGAEVGDERQLMTLEEKMLYLYEVYPSDVVFYIPQLVVYLVYGAFDTSTKLRRALLRICSNSMHFSHRLIWFISAFCLEGAGVTDKGRTLLQKLIADISVCGAVPALTVSLGRAKGESAQREAAQREATASTSNEIDMAGGSDDGGPRPPAVKLTAVRHSLPSMEEEGGGPTAAGGGNLDRLESGTSSRGNSGSLSKYNPENDKYPLRFTRSVNVNPSATSSATASVTVSGASSDASSGAAAFQVTSDFWGTMIQLSRDLVAVTRNNRSEELRSLLPGLLSRYLPSAIVYAPVGNVHHRIWAIHSEESFAFSTKTRAPMLLCLEVVEHCEALPFELSRRTHANTWLDDLESAVNRSVSNVSTSLQQIGAKLSLLEDLDEDPVEREETEVSALEAQTRYPFEPPRDDSAESESEQKMIGARSDIMCRGDDQGALSDMGQWADLVSAVAATTTDSKPPLARKSKRGEAKAPADREGAQVEGDRPIVVFKERWADKESRLRVTSLVGHLPGYRLLPVIVKSNDDLRQEQIASQMIFQIYQLLTEAKVDFWCRPYGIVAMSPDSGVIEAVPDTVSLDTLRRRVHKYKSLKDFFLRFYGNKTTTQYIEARKNFIVSLATYCIICYVLNLKDRHNGNILLDRLGHVIHIDFGFILGVSPGGNIGFESAPFKLTNEMVDLMEGPRSMGFAKFRDVCVKCFMELRRSHQRIVLLVQMLSVGNEHLPCFGGKTVHIIQELRRRFMTDVSDQRAIVNVHSLIDKSLDNWTTSCYDRYQRHCVGIL